MGKKGGSSPKAPAPIDPGKAMGEYMFGRDFTSYQGITDPRLQERTLAAEATYRPQYSALELADINTMWAGTEDGAANPAYTRLSAELAGLNAGQEAGGSSRTQAEIEAAALKLYPDKQGGAFDSYIPFSDSAKYNKTQAEYRKAFMTAAGDPGQDRAARIAEIEAQMEGMSPTLEGQMGYRGLLAEASRDSAALQREMLGLQRGEDVAALKEYAPQIVDAYRAADPYSTELADLGSERAKGLIGAERSEAEQLLGQRGLEFAASTGELTPLEQRRAQQSAREASTARGRGMDQSALYGEMQSRMAQEMNKQEREMAMGSQLLGQQAGLQQQRFGQEQAALGGAFGMNRQMAGDIGSTLLGRSSSAIGLGQQGLGQSIGMAAGQMGPQLFDPNVGMNMALAQRGQDVTFQGMLAQANAAQGAGQAGMFGDLMGAGATLGAAYMTGGASAAACWVAREVYGIENPKWMQFRGWMLNDAPSWFRSLYIGYGERFAKFISNKPLLKSIIRKWMDTKIK
jgi:hypothetical protein